jgi:hypothetical protein
VSIDYYIVNDRDKTLFDLCGKTTGAFKFHCEARSDDYWKQDREFLAMFVTECWVKWARLEYKGREDAYLDMLIDKIWRFIGAAWADQIWTISDSDTKWDEIRYKLDHRGYHQRTPDGRMIMERNYRVIDSAYTVVVKDSKTFDVLDHYIKTRELVADVEEPEEPLRVRAKR